MTDNPTREACRDVAAWQADRLEREAQAAAKRNGYDSVILRHEIARITFGSAAHGWRAEHQRRVLWRALAIAAEHGKEAP
jgi:hypothetical protein